jgi:hypothetical protein
LSASLSEHAALIPALLGVNQQPFAPKLDKSLPEGTNAKITGKASLDVVLAGNGTTSAVELLIDCIGLKHYEPDDQSSSFVHTSIVRIYYHGESPGCEVVVVPDCPRTFQVNMVALEQLLTRPEYDQSTQDGNVLGSLQRDRESSAMSIPLPCHVA